MRQTGGKEKTAVIHLGLEALIQREAARGAGRFDASAGCADAPAQRKEKMRILEDTSIWINHFRRSDSQLVQALSQQQVLMHPIVIGELATGNLRDRPGILADLQALPHVQEVTFTESLSFLEIHQLYARGLGWSDIQLLGSALLNGVSLWSSDKRLEAAARELRLR